MPSPGSVSLGSASSEEEDDEDGDAAEHRVNVRTGQHSPFWPVTLTHMLIAIQRMMRMVVQQSIQ